MSIEKRLFTPKTVDIFQTAQVLKQMLRSGYTTVREPGNMNDVGLRQAVEMGLLDSPRLVLAGGIDQTGGHFDEYYPSGVAVRFFGAEFCDGLPEVQKATRKVLREGYDFIKVCTSGGVTSPTDAPDHTLFTVDELKAIVYEANARGKAVIAHAIGTQGIKNALIAGIWSVEHGSMLDDEAIDLFLRTGAYLVPTLYILEDFIARGKEIGLTPVALAKAERVRELHTKSFARALAAGVKIAAGSDIIDDASHGRNACELELMVRHGMTPMQAFVSATRTAAEACRIDHKTGTLEPGKLADLIVFDGDPLSDIRLLQDKGRVLMVLKEGTCYHDALPG